MCVCVCVCVCVFLDNVDLNGGVSLKHCWGVFVNANYCDHPSK